MALTDSERREQEAAAKAERRAEQRPDRGAPDRSQTQRDREVGAGSPRKLAALRRHPWLAALAVVLIAAALGVGVVWWLNARQYESTDDAFIDTRVVPVSSEVAGQIVDVPVTDNELVKAGAPLVRIDPRNYQVAAAQAKAQLEETQANVANLAAQIDAQEAKIDQAHKQATEAEAALQFSEQQNERYQSLLKSGSGTLQQAQQAQSDLTQKRAALAGAQANATAVEKQLAVLRTQRLSAEARVAAARAALDQAEINLARTTVTASEEGRIANLTAAKGAYVQPGQALMSLVPRQVWVTANFKETQLVDMRVGQPVTITVDAYPGRVFHGHLQSIQAGSGTAFSLLPPENATGNYVKVVQRVPVKIVFDKLPDVNLGPGMSVVPSVKVR